MSKPTTFGPGPSALYSFIGEAMKEAVTSGILEASHRSNAFVNLFFETKELLHDRLNLPGDYFVYFLNSATEAWNVVAEGYVLRTSKHYFSGDFGRKWFDYTRKIHHQSVGIPFSPDEIPDVNTGAETELIALTHNETSNGSRVDCESISEIKRNNSHALIAVDATSSMAGVALNFGAADIWFASVQKCFGMPAGLGVMFASPRAVESMNRTAFDKRYNAILNIHRSAAKGQTVCTPNVLGIFLLNGVLKRIENVTSIDNRIIERSNKAYQIPNTRFQSLINNPKTRSNTVMCFRCDNPDELKHKFLERHNIQLGSGYGEWKSNTFRIANFPAVSDEVFNNLIHLLSDYQP
jgi:phosphoserine aminotransferase